MPANWEYKVVEASAHTDARDLQAELTGWGSMGWEAVGYTTIEKFGPNAVSVLMKRPASTLAPPADFEAGWYPDPTGRFESRLWDGDRWTGHVKRDGMRENDFPIDSL